MLREQMDALTISWLAVKLSLLWAATGELNANLDAKAVGGKINRAIDAAKGNSFFKVDLQRFLTSVTEKPSFPETRNSQD